MGSVRGLFLAGTDTGVGKTSVACALLRLAHRRGLPLYPYKPAESGLSPPLASDAERLREAALLPELPIDQVCPHRFSPPISPAAAAERAGAELTLDGLLTPAERLLGAGRPLLVEGAGGLLSPYAPNVTNADLAARLRLPILLVARNGLGTVNHTALTVAELRRRALPLAGVLLVNVSQAVTPDQRSNATWIRRLTGICPLGPLPYLDPFTPDDAASWLGSLLAAAQSDLEDPLLQVLA